MSTAAQKLKLYGYIVFIPLILAFIIFVIISNALGLDIIPIPFLNIQNQEVSDEEIEEIIEQKDAEIDSLEQTILQLNEYIDDLEAGQNSKQKDLEAREQELKELENSLVEREELLEEKEVRMESIADKYTNMRPRDAAAILQEMDDEEIIEIFNYMNSDTVSEILSSFEPSRAAVLTQKMM
ncbi:hypothetical protein PRVXT_001399 [Proteinivorax tanatarense]|uniref:Magnesium transporter MgtE intracellular domain-containing protein n=1 Tax=Proteinivorax tanatarense TaxID=1260629 RepID=A0AAU7VQH3_9FIRM